MTSSPRACNAAPMATTATTDIAAQESTSTVDAPASVAVDGRPAASWSWRCRANWLVGCMVAPFGGWLDGSASEDDVWDGGGDEEDEDRSDDEHQWERHRCFAFGHLAAEVFATCGAHVLAERQQRVGVAAGIPG